MAVPEQTLPVIVGPTASGKSHLALRLAARFPTCEIVSADSRQVYREISIGTAKPSRTELAAVPHHIIDITTVNTRYSAGQFARDARRAIDDILRRNATPIVVGGSGFYVRALFEGLSAPPMREETREELEALLGEVGEDRLHRELARVDEPAAALMPSRNHEKVIRALACFRETGRPYSSFTDLPEADRLTPSYLLLLPNREDLWGRISSRTSAMIEEGIVDETRSVLKLKGVTAASPGLRTVGYKEVIGYLGGGGSVEDLHEQIYVATRRYAKRQRTWFRNQISPALTLESGESLSGAYDWLQGLRG